jgi:MYXO-CTERM domain-containing protein
MQTYKTAFAVLCLSTVAASVHAQRSGYQYTQNKFTVHTSSNVHVSYSYYGTDYPIYTTGDGWGLQWQYGSYSHGVGYAYAASAVRAGPGAGTALASNDFVELLTFTDTTGTGSFSVHDLAYQGALIGDFSASYVQLSEHGGKGFLGYISLFEPYGYPAYSYLYNWSITYVYSNGDYYYDQSNGGFSDSIKAGHTITVRIRAYSYAEVSSTAVSSVPGPAAVAPFAVGLIAAIRRRKKV